MTDSIKIKREEIIVEILKLQHLTMKSDTYRRDEKILSRLVYLRKELYTLNKSA